jgi:hypothetical protein
MIGLGADVPESDFATVIEYLSTPYPADAMPPLNVNTTRVERALPYRAAIVLPSHIGLITLLEFGDESMYAD